MARASLTPFYFKDELIKYILILPILVYLSIFTLYPILDNLYISIASGSIFSLYTLPDFWQSLINTAIFSAGTVVLEFIIGLLIALLLDRTGRFGSLMLILFTVPILVSPVAVGVIWLLIYDPSFGPLNYFLSFFGINGPFWVGSKDTIMLSAILASVWEETPLVILVIYAALKSIPRYIYEAAMIDGLGTFSTIRSVIIPLMKPTLAVAGLLALMTSFRSFDLVYMFAINGPYAYVQTLPYLLYQVSFVTGFQQYGSALSVLIMVIALIPSFIFLRLLKISERLGLAKTRKESRFSLPSIKISLPYLSVRLPVWLSSLGKVKYVLISIFALLAIFPFYWILVTSVKDFDELFPSGGRVIFLPNKLDPSGWINALNDLYGYIITSLVVTISVCLITLAISIPAAYSISRFKTFGTKIVSWNIVVNSMPSVVLVIPLFLMVRSIGIYDTWFALISTYPIFTVPIATWLLIGFIEDIPKQIDDAARIDGLGTISILFRIIFPLLKPGIVASLLLTVINCWHEFLLTLILGLTVFDGNVPYGARGVTVYISNFISARGIDWSTISAAAVIVSIPLIILVVFLQRYYVSGLTLGAVKG